MNWEEIEQDFRSWVYEEPEIRMCSFRCFFDWLKENYSKYEVFEELWSDTSR
jgi:phenolic acid decarboxylase